MPTNIGVGLAVEKTSALAGRASTQQALAHYLGDSGAGSHHELIQVALVFASAMYDYTAVLAEVRSVINQIQPDCPALIVGCSSAGEFTHEMVTTGAVVVALLGAEHLCFSAGMGTQLRENSLAAVQQVAQQFIGLTAPTETSLYSHRAALLLLDSLAGQMDEVVEQAIMATALQYELWGGGAGDDGRFVETKVFLGDRVESNALVGLEVLSTKPLGLGMKHGWQPVGKPLRATSATANHLRQLNSVPAFEWYKERAQQLGIPLTSENTSSFLMENVLGLDSRSATAEDKRQRRSTNSDSAVQQYPESATDSTAAAAAEWLTRQGAAYKIRVPLAVEKGGALLLANEVPPGAIVRFMESTLESVIAAAEGATRQALARMNGGRPALAILFDCVATRLRLADAFSQEIAAVKALLPGVPLIGCNTYGQMVRIHGGLTGFHNTTAVICLIPA